MTIDWYSIITELKPRHWSEGLSWLLLLAAVVAISMYWWHLAGN